MNNKYLRLGNEFFNLDKLIFSEVSFDDKQLTLTFEGGIKKDITHSNAEGFMLLVYSPFCQALENGNYDWKPPKEVMDNYIRDNNL